MSGIGDRNQDSDDKIADKLSESELSVKDLQEFAESDLPISATAQALLEIIESE